MPQKAMMLAAGLGTRMRPLTETTPKPLVPVAGKPLIDWGLDALQRAGVAEAVVNIHHLPDLMTAHLGRRTAPRITISDERDMLLDSGGGVVKALPLLGMEPFLVLNADTFWIDRSEPNLGRLALAWDVARMDILMLLADPASATGHTGKVDFTMDEEGRLKRARNGEGGFIYAGAFIVHPRLFAGAPAGPHSLNMQFDQAAASGRFFGLPLDGHWITVGTPGAIAPAEAALRRLGAAP
ncbi:nucleotidyltransferase family protein [Chelativorans alearense]|uniref:nucleotidyltransferase family protein n=1 Tax=Chelativorans alearense TaxID=2681495 RepID=UPI0013D17692|nr:nucleotidyltransferase family protein [Chelativorans alearense]